MSRLMTGGTVVTLASRSLDAHELWRPVEAHRVAMCVIGGDAFARPMIRARGVQRPALKVVGGIGSTLNPLAVK